MQQTLLLMKWRGVVSSNPVKVRWSERKRERMKRGNRDRRRESAAGSHMNPLHAPLSWLLSIFTLCRHQAPHPNRSPRERQTAAQETGTLSPGLHGERTLSHDATGGDLISHWAYKLNTSLHSQLTSCQKHVIQLKHIRQEFTKAINQSLIITCEGTATGLAVCYVECVVLRMFTLLGLKFCLPTHVHQENERDLD